MKKAPRFSKSGIEYLDYQWGIFSGCENWKNGVCGVQKCWAKSFALRFKNIYSNGFEPTFYPEAVNSPKHLKKPSVIGVGWVGDVIGYCDKVSERSMILQTIMQCPRHRFVVLTKNTDRLQIWNPFPNNCWVGVTCTTRREVNNALPLLMQVGAGLTFISIEPLVEWDDYSAKITGDRLLDAGVGWVIIGAHTHPLRLPKMDSLRDIMQTCNEVNIPIFIKDNILANCEGELRLGEMRQEMPRWN